MKILALELAVLTIFVVIATATALLPPAMAQEVPAHVVISECDSTEPTE